MADKKAQHTKKSFIKRNEGIMSVLLFLGAIFLLWHGGTRMKAAYEEEKDEAYSKFYQTAYNVTEAKNHVANSININMEDIKKISRLEVLRVSDTEFVIKNADENSSIYSWLEVQGVGVFTVDLAASEFIKDSQRKYVLVNIPKPVLTECSVEKTGKQFWKNGSIIRNGSNKEGVNLSQEQMREGRMLIEDSIKQNRMFYDAANEAAVNMMTALVKKWNPGLQDLQVEVNFIEVD